jgi:hypothetical protein
MQSRYYNHSLKDPSDMALSTENLQIKINSIYDYLTNIGIQGDQDKYITNQLDLVTEPSILSKSIRFIAQNTFLGAIIPSDHRINSAINYIRKNVELASDLSNEAGMKAQFILGVFSLMNAGNDSKLTLLKRINRAAHTLIEIDRSAILTLDQLYLESSKCEERPFKIRKIDVKKSEIIKQAKFHRDSFKTVLEAYFKGKISLSDPYQIKFLESLINEKIETVQSPDHNTSIITSQQIFTEKMPVEILLRIVLNLDIKAFSAFTASCKAFNELLKNDSVLSEVVKKNYPLLFRSDEECAAKYRRITLQVNGFKNNKSYPITEVPTLGIIKHRSVDGYTTELFLELNSYFVARVENPDKLVWLDKKTLKMVQISPLFPSTPKYITSRGDELYTICREGLYRWKKNGDNLNETCIYDFANCQGLKKLSDYRYQTSKMVLSGNDIYLMTSDKIFQIQIPESRCDETLIIEQSIHSSDHIIASKSSPILYRKKSPASNPNEAIISEFLSGKELISYRTCDDEYIGDDEKIVVLQGKNSRLIKLFAVESKSIDPFLTLNPSPLNTLVHFHIKGGIFFGLFNNEEKNMLSSIYWDLRTGKKLCDPQPITNSSETNSFYPIFFSKQDGTYLLKGGFGKFIFEKIT